MLRAALYARFSTDMQSAASIDDQLRVCEGVAERIGATVSATYTDAAISGTTTNRPGLQALMADALDGKFDVVIAEALDRLTRSGGAAWDIFEDLGAAGVRIHTHSEGPVEEMAVILKGGMNALFIKDLAHKTRRGQEGVVASGRACDSVPYGYRRVVAHDAAGERIPGLREINPETAAVVQRIFRDYAEGVSPGALMEALNREGTPSPRGGLWGRSTILGNPKRGLGVLRNELYRGVRVWGRLAFVKTRKTGKRRAVAGSGTVQRLDAPDLRIIDDDLWNRVQLRLAETAIGPNGEGNGQKRPKALLSGLIRCGLCGGPMTAANGTGSMRCTVRTEKGLSGCTNTRTPTYARVEAFVLAGIEANLLHPLAIAEAVKAFNATMAEERRSGAGQREGLERTLRDVRERAERLVREVERGMPWEAAKDRHAELKAQEDRLALELSQAPTGAEIVPLAPNAAGAYRELVASLRAEVGKPDAAEAKDAIRRIVDEVRFIPLEGRGRYELEVVADMAPIMNRAGPETMRAMESGSRFIRSHNWTVTFRLVG